MRTRQTIASSNEPQVKYMVPCPDEEDEYPLKALEGDSLDALAAFCEVRFLVRRCEGCRDLLLRGKDLPEGFYSWQCMPPDIDPARKRVEKCRAALTVGIRILNGLQSKDDRIVDWKLAHEQAIEEISPLARALTKFSETSWCTMDVVKRVKFANRLLAKSGLEGSVNLGLMYVEAKAAATLLRLPKDDRRLVVDGAFACYSLDWLAQGRNASRRAEMNRHVKTIITVANDMKEYTLAERIEAATGALPKMIALAGSVLFDQFKGHLIETTKQALLKLKAAGPAGTSGKDIADATGLVADPMDKESYREANKIINDHPAVAKDIKALNRVLAVSPEIRRWKPRRNRLSIHAGDWLKYCDAQQQEVQPAPIRQPLARNGHLAPVEGKNGTKAAPAISAWRCRDCQHDYEDQPDRCEKCGKSAFEPVTERPNPAHSQRGK